MASNDEVSALHMEDFAAEAAGTETARDPRTPSMDLLINVPMRLSVELGRTRMPMKNILQLAQGSVIELDKAAGEPLSIYINGELFAYGEAVLVNQERFGVRLTALVNKEDLISNPREP